MHELNFKLITRFVVVPLLLFNQILHNTRNESLSIENKISQQVVYRKINPKENYMKLVQYTSLINKESKINSNKVVLKGQIGTFMSSLHL